METQPTKRPIFMAIWVHVTIAVAAMLFIVAIGLLYYRSLTLVEPNSIVEVQGNPSFEGAEVEISGPSLNGPLTATLGSKEGYNRRFFLDRGVYKLTVTQDGQTLFTRQFFMDSGRRLGLPLPMPDKAATQETAHTAGP